jgi:hypothetical protein
VSTRRRSPVWLDCQNFSTGFDNEKLCDWACDEDRLAAAEFSERGAPQFTAIVHRNTKPDRKTYPWQVSYFTNGEPTGDSTSKSCRGILQNVPHAIWRLRSASRR